MTSTPDELTLTEALASWRQWPFDLDHAPVPGQRLASETNRVWRLETGADPLVIRLNRIGGDASGLDRAREAAVLERLAGETFMPGPVWLDAHLRILVTPWVPGQHPEQPTPHLMRSLAAALARLHAIDPGDLPEVDPFAQIDRYYARLSGAEQQRLAGLQADIRSLRAATPRRCLCHFDLSPRNLLVNEAGVVILDWEFAGVGDPVFDLAAVASGLALTDAQTREWLASPGFRGVSPTAVAAARVVNDYMALVWRLGHGAAVAVVADKVKQLEADLAAVDRPV